jgi:hypothetical protein
MKTTLGSGSGVDVTTNTVGRGDVVVATTKGIVVAATE